VNDDELSDFVGNSCGLVLRYYSGIRLEGLRKPPKTPIGIAGRRDRDLNPGLPEYEGVCKLWRHQYGKTYALLCSLHLLGRT
jgi:hypothetical protein